MRILFILGVVAVIMSGCGATGPLKSETYKSLYDEKPLSILALPPINKSTKVEAKELFYSSVVVPLAEKGYYVMPPLLAMEILKEESAYDSEMFFDSSIKKMGEVFGVDAVLFTVIHEWGKTTLLNQVHVKIEYILKSTKTDAVLFDRVGDVTLKQNMNSGNALADLIGGMLAAALTKEIVVGEKCNYYTLDDLPAGRYNSLFGKDGNTVSGPKEFEKTL